MRPRRALTPRSIQRSLRALVRHVVPGARIYFAHRMDRRVRYSWNGRHLRPTGLTLESQCHEVAHVLVSAPSRRGMPEFGLGPDPYRHSDARVMVPARIADAEELAACAMQRLLVKLFGLDESAVAAEVSAAPLTVASVRALRRARPFALPGPWWQRALACVAADEARGPAPP